MTFDPTSDGVLCVTLPKDHCVQVPWKYIKVCGYSDLFCKKLEPGGSLTLDDLWPHICWGHMCDSTQGSLCPSPMKTHQSMWTQWPFCKKTWTKGHWPLDDLWPHICWGHMCDSTQGSLCPSPMGIHQCMWIQWSILQMTNQRSLTPRWPLITHLLRSHVWLYPRILVSKSHGNTSMYVDTVMNFANYHIQCMSYIHILCTYYVHTTDILRTESVIT